ncbi:MAG: ATP-dependent DNA helicase, partial [Desulfobacteraceae bacterium]|nr:ATP-dependent DNA helicase [Desulfobacteraceae bacterium]
MAASEKKTERTVAVRTLVEWACREGDLEAAFAGPNRTLEGIRGHRRVQQSRPAAYTAEVPVTWRLETDDLVLNVGGRIDGVLVDGDDVTIEEIKTTSTDLSALKEDSHPLHWAQAKAYAAIFLSGTDRDGIRVQLTYYHIETGSTREFGRHFGRAGLEAFLNDLAQRYLLWARTLTEWERRRDASIQSLAFPFPCYRDGQRLLAVAVYQTLKDGGRLIAEAATGIGKTMAVVFATVKAMPDTAAAKFFYLTARTTGRLAAETALSQLRRNGLRIKSVTLTAKEKICFLQEPTCHPDECPYARGHYDRIGGAVADAFSSDHLDRQAIEACARDHRVCPFELELEMSLWADAIVCDYNYAFDPRVYLRRYFDEGGDYVLLVDEAHNLVDRSREMFSAELSKQPFLDVRRALKDTLPVVYRAMGAVNRWMVTARKASEAEGGTRLEDAPPEALGAPLRRFLRASERWLQKNRPAAFRNDLLELYFSVSGFLRILEEYDDAYTTCYRSDGRNLWVKLFCVDPTLHMHRALARCGSAVFFSATLTPPAYFAHLFGCGDEARRIRVPSPFPPENFAVFVQDRVSTLYRDRSGTASEIADHLLRLVQRRRGNYLFYFPSYAYLQMVFSAFAPLSADMEILVQDPEMDEDAREAFIERFSASNGRTLAGFAVMGGIFGEGIDLVGDRLTGAAIVGVGLPGISPERERIRQYFEAVNGQGFAYAYMFPGINRVLQAAGRVIRTDADRGAVLLIDRRYGSLRYRSLLPSHWQIRRASARESFAADL